MQDFRPLVWVALLLVGIASFWLAYRFRRGLDDNELGNVEVRPQPRDAVVVVGVAVGSMSLGYALFDIFLLFNPSMR